METVKEKQVKTDNELFAEFIGAKLDHTRSDGRMLWSFADMPTFCKQINISESRVRVFYEKDLEFHTSWDWLMPCAQRFYKLYADSNHSKDWSWHYFEIKKSLANADINAAYNSLVNAIRWYNTQTLPPIKQ